MSHIHSSNTKPEEKVRKYLFANGFRYRKNVRKLPGTPDIVLPKYKTVVFINGCFWHKHDCSRFVWPKDNSDYWRAKIEGNVSRDKKNNDALQQMGWHVITVWECQVKKDAFQATMDKLIAQIRKGEKSGNE